ncbi:MAG: orotate phosphoribosyltransferase [Gemmataceae bacterium]|nr:orotate phosphoribosyltransferase [Gemmataceae bacterium]
MSDIDQQLLQILKSRSFRSGTFRLTSGGTSTYYIDGRMSAVFSKSAHLIGEAIYERTKHLKFDAIGGLAVGAVPIATATVISYHLHGREMEGFWVRDEVKQHGTKKLIEGGGVKAGARVIILDDVLTTGGSAVKALRAVREEGCEVIKVMALVDRLAGAAQIFQQEGVTDYEPLFSIRDFGVDVPEAVSPASVEA